MNECAGLIDRACRHLLPSLSEFVPRVGAYKNKGQHRSAAGRAPAIVTGNPTRASLTHSSYIMHNLRRTQTNQAGAGCHVRRAVVRERAGAAVGVGPGRTDGRTAAASFPQFLRSRRRLPRATIAKDNNCQRCSSSSPPSP